MNHKNCETLNYLSFINLILPYDEGQKLHVLNLYIQNNPPLYFSKLYKKDKLIMKILSFEPLTFFGLLANKL